MNDTATPTTCSTCGGAVSNVLDYIQELGIKLECRGCAMSEFVTKHKPQSEMEKRVCSVCGQTKRLSQFPFKSSWNRARRTECAECRRARL